MRSPCVSYFLKTSLIGNRPKKKLVQAELPASCCSKGIFLPPPPPSMQSPCNREAKVGCLWNMFLLSQKIVSRTGIQRRSLGLLQPAGERRRGPLFVSTVLSFAAGIWHNLTTWNLFSPSNEWCLVRVISFQNMSDFSSAPLWPSSYAWILLFSHQLRVVRSLNRIWYRFCKRKRTPRQIAFWPQIHLGELMEIAIRRGGSLPSK